VYVLFAVPQEPPRVGGFFIVDDSRLNSDTLYILYDSSGRVISPTQMTLTFKTQHTQQENIHAPVPFRTHNPIKRKAAGTRLITRGYWDW
jgi:hypothetical protein